MFYLVDRLYIGVLGVVRKKKKELKITKLDSLKCIILKKEIIDSSDDYCAVDVITKEVFVK